MQLIGDSREGSAYYYASEHLCSIFVLASSSATKFTTSMYVVMLHRKETTPSRCSVCCCMNNVNRMTNASLHRPVYGVGSLSDE
jgi:hypothetical protein